MQTQKKVSYPITVFIVILPLLVSMLCIGIGRYSMTPLESIEVLLSPLTGAPVESTQWSVIYGVRLPRIILALFVGAGLSVAGAGFQALFSNPLATPDTLGVASGASFGAVLGLLFGASLVVVQLLSLLLGLIALVVTTAISRMHGKSSIIMVVLGGMVVSSLFQAFVSLVKYVADPEEVLPTITYWLMGSMSRATYPTLAVGLPFIAVGILFIYLLRWRLNILSLQEDEAKSLGVNIRVYRACIMVASTLITAASVSMCGQVGWVGLLIPHATRMLYGSDNKQIIPMSACLGAAFMVVIDTAARAATAAEIPVSILTAIIGAPFFIFLLYRTGGAKL
ncbi:MAG: iron ABC transporter permease [Eubacteriales bacterium]